MLADQLFDLGLGLLVKRVVAGPHVGVLRVAALRRDADGAEQRVLGRRDLERAVGMPEPVAKSEEPRPVVAREDLVVLVQIGYIREGGGEAVLVRSPQA